MQPTLRADEPNEAFNVRAGSIHREASPSRRGSTAVGLEDSCRVAPYGKRLMPGPWIARMGLQKKCPMDPVLSGCAFLPLQG